MSEPEDYKYEGKKYSIKFSLNKETIKVSYNNIEYSTDFSLNKIKEKIEEEINKISKPEYSKIPNLIEKRKKFQKNFDVIKCFEKNIKKKN